MKILDLLATMGLAAPQLVAFLEQVKASSPDLAPLADRWLLDLNSAVSVQNIATLAEVILPELSNIARGKLDPKDHPSDSI